MGIAWKYASEAEVSAFLARDGLSIDRAKANYRRRFPLWSEEKIQEELELGPLLESVLKGLRAYARANPQLVESLETELSDLSQQNKGEK